MRIPTLRGDIELDEPGTDEMRQIIRASLCPDQELHALLVRAYLAGAQAMRDELEQGRGARLEAALLGAYRDR